MIIELSCLASIVMCRWLEKQQGKERWLWYFIIKVFMNIALTVVCNLNFSTVILEMASFLVFTI